MTSAFGLGAFASAFSHIALIKTGHNISHMVKPHRGAEIPVEATE
jgi:hypothetical protein